MKNKLKDIYRIETHIHTNKYYLFISTSQSAFQTFSKHILKKTLKCEFKGANWNVVKHWVRAVCIYKGRWSCLYFLLGITTPVTTSLVAAKMQRFRTRANNPQLRLAASFVPTRTSKRHIDCSNTNWNIAGRVKNEYFSNSTFVTLNLATQTRRVINSP